MKLWLAQSFRDILAETSSPDELFQACAVPGCATAAFQVFSPKMLFKYFYQIEDLRWFLQKTCSVENLISFGLVASKLRLFFYGKLTFPVGSNPFVSPI